MYRNASLSASKICTFTEQSVHTSDLNVKKTSYFVCLTACLLTFERFKMNNCKNTVRLLVLWIRILAYYFSKIYLHNSSNIKKSLKSHKPAEIKVFLALFLPDEGRILTRTNYDGSGKPLVLPKTYGS
jgi:hypothetical protein